MEGSLVYGLDLGINNVGWCALRKREKDVDVLAVGTFVFDSPLADSNKPSEGLKSKLRGQFRRARRTTRRRHQRKMALYRLLAEHGFLPSRMADRVELLCKENPYALRADALKRKLEPYELGRVLCHFNQRRGFLSPRDLMLWGTARFEDEDEPGEGAPPKDKEEDRGQIKKELKLTREEMADFETVGAFLYDRQRKGLPVRKKSLKGATKAQQKAEDERRFRRTDRHMIEDEFWKIMVRQAPHFPLLTKALQARIHDLLFHQRILAADASTRGTCTFYRQELRMPRAGLTAQKFVLAQEVANLEVVPGPLQDSRKLTSGERQALVATRLEGLDLTWDEVRKKLELPAAIFSMEPAKYKILVNGKEKTVTQRSGTKEKLRGSQTVSRLRKVLGDKWDALNKQAQRELVGEIVSIRDWTRDSRNQTKGAAFRRLDLFKRKSYGPNAVTFTEREANELATLDLPEGYLNVSLKAAKKIIPHMLRDKTYDKACQAVGLDHANPEGELPTLDRLPFPNEKDIPHAVVRASVRSAVRVLNALHREYGKPDAIHIELPRDLAMGAEQREEVKKRQHENENERVRIAKDLVSIGIKPSGQNIKKVRLWEELGGKALPYEPDLIIPDLRTLMDGDYEVDHIVPRSHSLDSGMANLTLSTREFNTQVKGKKTLWEAVGQADPERWRRIEAHVKSIKNMPLHKRQRILAKERPKDFTGRHLAATGYISREVLKLAQQMVANKTDVVVAPGRATSEFRRFWALDDLVPLHPVEQAAEDAWKAFLAKADAGEATEEDVKNAKPPGKTRSNFKHHALDAIVVALADRKSLKAMTDYYQLVELNDPRLRDKEHRKLEHARAMPDPNLRAKVQTALERAEIVHRPQRTPRGELHQQMPKNEGGLLKGLPKGEPWGTAIIGKHLVKYDQDGKPAQAYPLGNNHHVVIWERTSPNEKGEFERAAEVVPTIEAVRRRNKGEPAIRKTRTEPGWRFVLALCKGDMVEMEDGRLGVVSAFGPEATPGAADIKIWQPYCAAQIGGVGSSNPYLVLRLRSTTGLHQLSSRIVLSALGRVVYREGPPE